MALPFIVVGLTGGIGSGKSTVALLFSQLGARVIDADSIVHRLLDRPTVRSALVRAFGRDVVRRGRIDRAAVARKAFASQTAVRKLNQAVHPHVRKEIQKRLAAARKSRRMVVLDAALLLEAGSHKFCDVLVFVDAPRAARERRVRKRGWKPGELRRREKTQWSVARKRARADYVVRNDGTKTALKKKVERILKKISKLYMEAR